MELTESQYLDWLRESIPLFLPEITLLLTAVGIIILSLFNLDRTVYITTLTGILVHIAFSAWYILLEEAQVYSTIIVFQVFPVWIKVITSFAALITVAISRRQKMEYFLLIIAILLGADILAMSTNFIMILLSMEMISLSSYVLVAGNVPDKHRAEAAWKFFIYGSVATAVMIFGMSYIFGASGSILLSSTARPMENSFMFSLGGFMMLAGFLFKMTAAPLHLWAPDVYQSAPAPIIAFLSVVPKLAAFVVVIRSVAYLGADSTPIVTVISMFSIIVGTLAALNQSDSKRMMAYSSVAQAGFFLAIIAGETTYEVGVYYSIVFAIANYAVFIVIAPQKETSFSDFGGFGYSNPFAAVAITLGLVSLVGLPPVAGFMAKLSVFTGIWAKYQQTNSSLSLALLVTGLVATVASLFFYLKIPFYAFFRRDEQNQPIKITLVSNLLLIILVALLLALFVAPGLVDGLHE